MQIFRLVYVSYIYVKIGNVFKHLKIIVLDVYFIFNADDTFDVWVPNITEEQTTSPDLSPRTPVVKCVTDTAIGMFFLFPFIFNFK